MKKNNTAKEGKHSANDIIERAYGIIDEWNSKEFSSRRIVSRIKGALSEAKKKGAKSEKIRIELIAYLYALDMRIKEKYTNILRCIFSYFSWRRETDLLKLLRKKLRISPKEDIRTAIEVRLDELIERIALGKLDDDGDDETHGGKRNGSSDEEAVTSEEKEQEEASNDSKQRPSDIDEAKEAQEEKSEEKSENTRTEKEKVEAVEEQKAEEQTEKSEVEAEKEETLKEEQEPQEELDSDSEPEESKSQSSKRQKEENPFNDFQDPPPIRENVTENKQKEKISFIDEVIMDNMIKGKADIIGHNPLADVRNERDNAMREAIMWNVNDPENRTSDRDSHLYDAHLFDRNMASRPPERDGGINSDQMKADAQAQNTNQQSLDKNTTQQPQESDIGTPPPDQAKTDSQSQNTSKENLHDIRIPVWVDMESDPENAMRRIASYEMKSDTVQAIHDRLEEEMREHIKVVEAEHDAQSSKKEVPQTQKSESQTIVQGRK